MDTVWDRPARRPTAPLDRERIVAAAVALADADGLDAVSFRRVAAALDAGPMRLYGHVGSKEDLLELMVDAVYAEVAPVDDDAPSVGWRATVRALARSTREAALRHPWFADLLGGRPHLGPHALAALEARLAALREAPGGRDPAVLRTCAGAVHAYVVGAVRREIGERRAARASGLDEAGWQAATGPHLARMLATGDFPVLAGVIGQDGADPAAEFEAGLDLLLEGIGAGRRAGTATADVAWTT